MPDSLDNVSRSCFALSAQHGGAFGNATQCLSQVSASAYEGHSEASLVNVILLIRNRQDLGLVNVINLQSLENLGVQSTMPERSAVFLPYVTCARSSTAPAPQQSARCAP